MNRMDIKAAIIGSVVADALGVPYEFRSKQDMKDNPATTMTGYGTYNQEPGTWSDDSSFIIATMDSLLNDINYDDMMRKFSLYYFEDAYTPDNHMFDIGYTTRRAINNYTNSRSAIECGCDGERDNGNGSLMRIIPIILYLYDKQLSADEKREIIYNLSALTHSHIISKASCYIYNIIIEEILSNRDKLDFKKILENSLDKSCKFIKSENLEDSFDMIISGKLLSMSDEEVYSKGYVVDSLNLAIYTCYHTDSYKESVLRAVNYGGDTDTNALITAGLSALYYGYDDIPQEWIDKLKRKEYLFDICDKFSDAIDK